MESHNCSHPERTWQLEKETWCYYTLMSLLTGHGFSQEARNLQFQTFVVFLSQLSVIRDTCYMLGQSLSLSIHD